MDPRQQPPVPYSQPETQETPQPRPSFWRRHRVLLAVLAFIVVAGAAGGALLYAHKKTAAKTPAASSAKKNVAQNANPNHWKSSVNPAALPLGDGKVAAAPQAGYVDSCTTHFRGGGAQHDGPWINTASATWDSGTKVAVQGSVTWTADYSEKVNGSTRIITTNDLPKDYTTGTFPIARTDPAYQYDRNPNGIGTQAITYELPLNPAAAASPTCTGLGAIGVLSDGVLLFNGLDAGGRDAVAHETQDSCDGHPDGQQMYHYHDVPVCLRDNAKGSSTLVGYALDGYGIYVERDAKGNLPTNADLDVCHGRTSEVTWNGKKTTIYHYDATLEYPYTLGCYHGTPASSPSANSGAPKQP